MQRSKVEFLLPVAAKNELISPLPHEELAPALADEEVHRVESRRVRLNVEEEEVA
jgi:hypothetical protein